MRHPYRLRRFAHPGDAVGNPLHMLFDGDPAFAQRRAAEKRGGPSRSRPVHVVPDDRDQVVGGVCTGGIAAAGGVTDGVASTGGGAASAGCGAASIGGETGAISAGAEGAAAVPV